MTDTENKQDWRLEEYANTVKEVLEDFEVEPFELSKIKKQRIRMGVSDEQVRSARAKAFAAIIARFTDDDFLDDAEAQKIKKLWDGLDLLGWAPGQIDVRSE